MASRTVWKPLLAFCAAGALLTGPAGAQESDASSLPDAARITFTTLTGTLAKARSTGSVALGYREDAIRSPSSTPASSPWATPSSCARRWCRPSRTPSRRTVDIQWVPVTADSRIDAVVTGRVDLECGSTTSNVERQKRVAFSPVIFVAGTKVMVKWGSPISSFRDLAGRTVAVTAGTTNEGAARPGPEVQARHAAAGREHPRRRLRARDPRRGRRLRHRRCAAVRPAGAARQGGRRRNGGGGRLPVLRPYAIMFRKDDPQLAQLVRTASRCWPRMARSSASTAAGSCASCPPAPAWICP